MANPQILIEIKTIGADKSVKSTDKIFVSVEKLEKATEKLNATSRKTGDGMAQGAKRSVTEMAKAKLAVKQLESQMLQFQRSVRQAGGNTQLSARVAASFKALSRTMLDNTKSTEQVTAATLKYQTVLQQAKNDLDKHKTAQEKAKSAADRLAKTQDKTT